MRTIVASRWWLCGVVALGATLRIAHVLALRRTIWFDHLVVDPQFYDDWAQRIAAGDWLGGDRAFYMDPLYSYVLAILYRVAGHDLLLARLLNVAFSAGACVVVALIGRRVGGRSSPAATGSIADDGALVGGLAALGLALYEPDIFYVGEVDKTSLSMLLGAAAFALVLGRSLRARFAAGAAIAAAALTRANFLVFVPLAAVAALLDRDDRAARVGRVPRSVAAAALVVAGAGLVLAPVAWRNHHVAGVWVVTTSQGGQNFYTGNNPTNPYGAYGAVPFVRANPYFEEIDFRAEAEARAGRSLSPNEVSWFWFREAFRHMREHPSFAARAFARKLLLFWNDFEISDNQDQYLLERYSPVLRLPLLGFGTIAPFALLGALAFAPTRRSVRLLGACVVVYWLSLVAFFLFSRYRIPVATALLPLAALGALELVARLRARRGVAPAAVAIVAGAVVCFVHVGLFWRDHPVTIEMRLRHLADMQATVGLVPEAIVTLKEAVAPCPPGCPWALADLFELYLRTGRAAEGEAWFREFVATHPQQLDAPEYLERLHAARGGSPGG